MGVCLWEDFARQFEDSHNACRVKPVILILQCCRIQEYRGNDIYNIIDDKPLIYKFSYSSL